MDNPILEPIPSDKIEQIHHYTRDLAYMATERIFHSRLRTGHNSENPHAKFPNKIPENLKLFREKWGLVNKGTFPSFELLVSFGYLTPTVESTADGPQYAYWLTPKAFELLDKPIKPPDVFISYKRTQSSALALLIEARLRIAGVPNPFLDKNIPAGDDWHGRLENTIKRAKYFICLITENTLGSPSMMVEKEINWACEAPECQIISIWHGGYTSDKAGDLCPPILRHKQNIAVKEESAIGYETAIIRLLNDMGYRTY